MPERRFEAVVLFEAPTHDDARARIAALAEAGRMRVKAVVDLDRRRNQEIAETLRREIAEGRRKPGESITVADVAAEYDVGKETARIALRLLRDDRLVVAYRRRGHIVQHAGG